MWSATTLWGLLFGSAFFWIPGLGPLLVAGPLVSWIVGALEGAIVVGGLSAIGAGLYSLGIPKDSILRYETALKTGKYVLIAHGSMDDNASLAAIPLQTIALKCHPSHGFPHASLADWGGRLGDIQGCAL
jgi:hypothetical protein